MSNYQLTPGVHRVQSGVGSDGEIYGGIFLNDEPGILIGASGGKKFVDELETLFDEINFNDQFRVYLPVITYQELFTLQFLQKRFPDINLYVHKATADIVETPEDLYFTDRFVGSEAGQERFRKKLPRELENIIRIDRSSSFETANTKILIVPFNGPHTGHFFVYSRDHKLLCSGLSLGRTSSPTSYFFDLTGSMEDYLNSLSFLEKAKSDIIAPVYDEPEFTKDLTFKVKYVRDAISRDRDNILKYCSLKWKTLEEIVADYMTYHDDLELTEPYNVVELNATRIKIHLDWLVKQGKLTEKDGNYRMK